MKNSTSLLFKLLLFSLIIYASSSTTAFGQHSSTTDNTTNGKAEVIYTRYNSGNLVPDNLYLQAKINNGDDNDDNNWVDLYHIDHYLSDGNKYDITWWTNYCTVEDIGSYRSKITINGPPSGVYNVGQKFRWQIRNPGSPYNLIYGNPHNFPVFQLTFYKPEAPTGLEATKDLCNQINLSWNAPANIDPGATNTYYIYHNYYGYDYNIGSTTSRTFSWTGPTGPTDGTNYNFKVRLRSDSNYGLYSNPFSGNSKPIPVSPSNVEATTNNCDGKIVVTWNWSAAQPNNFAIYRSTSENVNGTLLSSTIAGDINSFEDNTANRNTLYYYKLRAKNDCGDWGDYSSAAEGITPDTPNDPSNLNYTVANNIISLTWTDNSVYEEKFVLTRTNVNTGVTNNYEVDRDAEFFDDDNAQLCIPYQYELKAVNACGESNTISTENIVLTPELGNTFPENSFNASKGFFPDIVHLEWDNNNRNQISTYYIYRKVFESTDSTLLTTLDGSLASYDDEYAENGILYEYSIIAEALCDTISEWSNVGADIGFRNPSATVSGKITYGTGSPVKGITVTAESDDLLTTTSLVLDGTSSYLEIQDKSAADIANQFTFQAYIRSSEIKSSTIFTKGDQYQLDYTGNAFEFSVGTNVLTVPYAMPLDTFVHVSVSYDGETSALFLDGVLMDSKAGVAAAGTNSLPFIIGKENAGNYFNGYIDEIRIWEIALDTTRVQEDYNRYIPYRNDGLIGYYRLNENINVDLFFDLSKSATDFNENHGVMYNTSYSTIVPETEQLWFRGLSNEKGDYLITGIPYFTDGSSFNIVPMLAPHEFNPGSKTLFVSDESQVHNNIDFTDISSFMVTGTVAYRNTNYLVSGVQILVDGEVIFGPDAKPEVTNENGEFEIEVPIGYHYISLRKPGHTFENGGRYPYSEAYPDSIVRHNFTKNFSIPKPFSDTTLITVVGRVIGGTGSNTIPFGFEQAKNNIGKATITLTHDSNSQPIFDNTGASIGDDIISYNVATAIDEAGDTTFTTVQHKTTREQQKTKIFTSSASGEFVAKLIPEKFEIVEIGVNADAAKDVANFFGNRFIDLSVNPGLKYEYLYDENGVLLDSLAYHMKLNYIYQTKPDIDVTNVDDTEVFYGEDVIVLNNPETGLDEELTIAEHFIYPIFKMFSDYSSKISIFESYINYDNSVETRQSIKEAEIKIINDLALEKKVKTYELKPEMDGVVVDTFKVGVPNITKSEGDQTSFTKTMQINVTVDGNTFSWLPDNELYRAYIIGQRPKGNNFYTEGLQIPEVILHDPPGSKSYAYIEKGSSYSVSSGFSTDFENGSGFGLEVLLGANITAGGGLAGPVIEADTKNSGKTGLSFSTSVSESGEYVQTFEFNERIETSSDPAFVGAMADIFIGKSYNYFYGETDNLKIVPFALATSNGITALGNSELNDTKYTLGIVEGFIMNPDNSDTYFKYTQAHILNKLLPELESRRNNLFLTSKRSDGILKYKTAEGITASDLRYGIAHSYEVKIAGNDTTVYGYYKMSDTDSILSYTFRPEKQTIEDLNNILDDEIYENDSIRYYNDQIGVWIDAIRLNEAEKAMAIKNNVLDQNISFDGGVGAITRSETQTFAYNKEESRTKNMHFGAQGSVGFAFNSTGLIATGELTINHSLGVSSGESFSQSMEFGYTLEDGDPGDYYSVNVYRRPEKGIYNAKDLKETSTELPGSFDFGILGQGVALVGGGIAVAAATSYNAGGGVPIVAGAATMAVAAGLSYIPYVSFQDKVTEAGAGDRFNLGEIRVTSFDISSPIFSTLGGQTSCPYQGKEETFFFRDPQNQPVVLQKATLQRDKPGISAEPAEIFNIPVTDGALYTIKIANNSESDDGRWYTVTVDEKTNPGGAVVKIDGDFDSKTVYVAPNTTLNKLLTITPSNPAIMDYDSIGIIVHSICQYDPTDFIPDIADTVYISAHFQAACTNVEILEPLDNWVVNVEDKDTMTIRLGGYNLSHDSFESFRFEYKPSSGSQWIPAKYFVNDPLLANKDQVQDTILIDGASFVAFEWSMTGLKDRSYDIRAVSTCSDADGSENESTILTGVLDGLRPQIFGTPQPADGILNIDENISIQFNEPIESGLLNQFNFDVKGTLNNYLLKHEAYIRMNGSADYSSIPEGISFNDKSFTIEYWVRTDDYRDAVILSQGNDPASSLEMGIKNGETYFKIGNVEYSAPFQFTSVVPAEAWQHMAYVYDYENGDVFIYQNDKIILEVRGASITFNNSGKIYLGKSSVTGGDHFSGSVHELRIWSKYLDKGEVYANQYTALSGNEVGLYGYWPIDEAFGALAIDKAANRHMEVFAPWEAYPGGSSWDFSGNKFLEFYTGYFSIIPEMDYTMEFWFRDNNPTDTICLFSNHKGDGTEGSGLTNKALSVLATPDGKIWVASNGNLVELVSEDHFDNKWHHFAMVVRRRGNVISYVDGQVQNEKENLVVGGIAGAKMYLGVRKWNNNSGSGEDKYYAGKLDEFRIWNLAKTTTQIRMDMNSKLHGEEIGLMVYFPFEGYYADGGGVMQSETTLENLVSDVNATNAVAIGGNSFSTDAPNMKDVRPVESIAYDYVASEDKIILNPKSYLFPQLEKNIIEITVEGVEDKYGNRMASPRTWTAYVHRNQVRWEDERRMFTKEIYKTLEFVSSIKNTGGQQIGFNLINLPPWLSAQPASGVINPESTVEIKFTINPALNIGEYNEDIILRTENGFDEKLPITVKVFKTPPNWKVNPAAFENTMNMVGVVKIEGVLSTDVFDKVAVFVNDTIRGVSNVRYMKKFDSYLVFLNVYGNLSGEKLEFRLWDASVGQILDDVKPFDITFIPNGIVGSTLDPVIYEATGLYRQYIPVRQGWNWLSFNKLSRNQNSLNSFLSALEPSQNDQIKTHGGGFNNFDLTTGWVVGGIDSIDNRRMYQMKISKNDTIVYSGESIVPEENPLDLYSGWNHIGYLPDQAMDVNDALRLYVADTSEVIKSQYAFAMFDPRVGWLGTLEVMEPGLGYMMNVRNDGSFKYPNTTVFKSAKLPQMTSPPIGWERDLSAYESNLSIIARVDLSNTPDLTMNDQMVLGAFINDEIHGYTAPIINSGIGFDPFFLNVNSTEKGQWIDFRLYDGLTGNTYSVDEMKPFAPNVVYGSTQNPLDLTLKGVITGSGEYSSDSYLRCYPNPFNDQITIEFSESLNKVTVDVLNATGSVVSQIYSGYTLTGDNRVVWNGRNQNGSSVATGIYYIRFVSGDNVESVKISKTR